MEAVGKEAAGPAGEDEVGGFASGGGGAGDVEAVDCVEGG